MEILVYELKYIVDFVLFQIEIIGWAYWQLASLK